MIKRIFTLAWGLLAASAMLADTTAAQKKLKVVTSTSDLHSLAHEVGGNRITATAISVGYQDPHYVEAKPSFVLQLRDADVFAFVGLDLEIGWMGLLIDGARNARIKRGGSGYLDVSTAVPVLDLASGYMDRSQGDVHPLGNPHYWLDPENGKRIARLFKATFTRLDPAGASEYARNLEAFEKRLDAARVRWAPLVAQIKGKPVVAWHTSWRYFANYTGMNIVGFMEPKPGVPPSAQHLAGLVQTMKRTGASVIVLEPFSDHKTADHVAGFARGEVLVLPPSVGG
ncbi:MAG: metal ABC transporter substrate-binding protein, partial [Gemmatimonadaceae bacterium]